MTTIGIPIMGASDSHVVRGARLYSREPPAWPRCGLVVFACLLAACAGTWRTPATIDVLAAANLDLALSVKADETGHVQGEAWHPLQVQALAGDIAFRWFAEHKGTAVRRGNWIARVAPREEPMRPDEVVIGSGEWVEGYTLTPDTGVCINTSDVRTVEIRVRPAESHRRQDN